MALVTEDDVVAALSGGFGYCFPTNEYGVPGAHATGLVMASSWIASHRRGQLPAMHVAETCSASTPGAAPLPALSPGKQWRLGAATVGLTTGQHCMILDRLAQVRVDPTITTAQTVDMSLPARAGGGTGVIAFAEIVKHNAVSATALASALTVTYTNSSGVGGQTGTLMTTQLSAAAPTVNSVWGATVPILQATGDRGIASIQTVQFPQAWNVAYEVVITLCRVVWLQNSGQSTFVGVQLGFYDLATPDLGTSPCIFHAITSTPSPPPVLIGRFVQV